MGYEQDWQIQIQRNKAFEEFVSTRLTEKFFKPHTIFVFSYLPKDIDPFDEEGEPIPVSDFYLSFISDKETPDADGYFDKYGAFMYTEPTKIKVLGSMADVQKIVVDTPQKLRDVRWKRRLQWNSPYCWFFVSPFDQTEYDVKAEVEKLLPAFEEYWSSLQKQ